MNTRRWNLSAALVAAACGALATAQPSTQPDRTTTDRARQPDRTTTVRPGGTDTARDQRADMNRDRAMSAQLVPADWIMKDKVVSAANREDLGTVKDLIVDARDGRVLYGVVAHGGVLKIGEKDLVVPWQAFNYEGSAKTLSINMTRDQLNSAPTFDEKDWNLLGDRSWRRRVGSFYRTDRTDRYGYESHDYRDWTGSGLRERLNAAQTSTLRGTVRDIDFSNDIAGFNDAATVTITDDRGGEHTVVLGPAWFVEHQRQMVHTGDQVEITGSQITADNKTVVVARSLSGPGGQYTLLNQSGWPSWDLSAADRAADKAADRRDETVRRDADKDRMTNREAQASMGNGPLYVKASKIRNSDLRNRDGKDLGTTDDFVFDANTGRIAFVAVKFGGFLGIGDTRVAVPWDIFGVTTDGKLYLGDVTQDQLKSAPRFEKSDWADLNDPAFAPRVYQNFGRSADWLSGRNQWGRSYSYHTTPGMNDTNHNDRTADNMNREYTRNPGDTTTAREGTRDTNRDAARDSARYDNAEYLKFYTTGRHVQLNGTIVRVEDAAPMNGLSNVARVTIRTDQGEKTIDLAPKAFFDRNSINLTQGQQVTINGREATINGMDRVIATDIRLPNGTVHTLRMETGAPAWNQK